MPNIDIGLIITAINQATGLKGVGDDVKKIGENAQATSNRLKAIQVVLAGIAVNKIREMADAFLKAASANQLLDLRMAAFAGGVPQANQVWQKLNAEFGATPFKVDNISQAWIKLNAVIGNNAESTRIIEAVVNSVAAMGGSDSQITDLTVALQRMLATGKVEGRQFKSIITDAGLSIGDLAKAAGVGTQAFNRQLNDGLVSAKTLIDAFVKASNDKFGDFAIKLGSTLGGAMNKIENDFSGALSRLGERTDINERLTVAFQKLDAEVITFIDNISQGQIDQFFDTLASFEPIVRQLGTILADIAIAAAGVGKAMADVLNALPSEATEYGIIGYVIWGRKGALIGVAFGLLDKAVRTLMNSVVQGLNAVGIISDQYAQNFAKVSAQSTLDTLSQLLGGAGQLTKGLGGSSGGIFARDDAAMQKIKKNLAGIAATKPSVTATTGPTDAMLKALEAANAFAEQFANTITRVNDDFDRMAATVSGDELGAKVEGINKQFDGWITTLEDSIQKELALKVHTGENALLVEMARERLASMNELRDAAIAKEQALFALKTKEFALDQQIQRLQLTGQIAELQRTSNTNAGFNLLGGTAGGQAQITLFNTELSLRQQILQTQQEQVKIDQQIMELGGPGGPNAQRVAELQKTKDLYKDLGAAADDVLKHLSIEGQLAKEMWTDIGNKLHNDVASGIKGLIDGTMTLGQVAQKVWSDITDSVIQYLLKLAEAKAMSSLFNSAGGSTGGGLGSIFGSLFGAANGMAFRGSVTPFANGGLTTGPTLFGLMGEAGTEAVMPLTRIGGKLGVRSEGGGNHYHISVQAIDTQSGLEFIGKHIEAIDANLGQRQTLHRSRRTSL